MALQTLSFAALIIGALVFAFVVAGVVSLVLAVSKQKIPVAVTIVVFLFAIVGIGLAFSWTTQRRTVVMGRETAVLNAERERSRQVQVLIEQQRGHFEEGRRRLDSVPADVQQELLRELRSDESRLSPIVLQGSAVRELTPHLRPPVEAIRDRVGPLEVDERTLGVAQRPLPEWTRTRTARDGEKTLVVVSSQQFATPEQSRQDALQQARSLVQWDFDAEKGNVPLLQLPETDSTSTGASGPDYQVHIGFGETDQISYAGGEWQLRPQDVATYAVKDRTVEEIRRSAGENDFTVYRTHLLVELSPEVRSQIEPIWRQQVSQGRSTKVGGALALLTVIVGIFAGYFRLDDRTSGRYRWPLRMGTVAALGIAIAACFLGARIFASEAGASDFEPRSIGPQAPGEIYKQVPTEVHEPMVHVFDSSPTTPCQASSL